MIQSIQSYSNTYFWQLVVLGRGKVTRKNMRKRANSSNNDDDGSIRSNYLGLMIYICIYLFFFFKLPSLHTFWYCTSLDWDWGVYIYIYKNVGSILVKSFSKWLICSLVLLLLLSCYSLILLLLGIFLTWNVCFFHLLCRLRKGVWVVCIVRYCWFLKVRWGLFMIIFFL
jgi:hypothetical protein